MTNTCKPLKVWRETEFELNGCYRIPGYTYNALWNGWECPHFTKEQGLELVKLYVESKLPASYNEDDDAFMFTMDEYGDEDSVESFEGSDYDVNGEIMHLYPIGAWCWVWDECDPLVSPEDEDDEDESVVSIEDLRGRRDERLTNEVEDVLTECVVADRVAHSRAAVQAKAIEEALSNAGDNIKVIVSGKVYQLDVWHMDVINELFEMLSALQAFDMLSTPQTFEKDGE